MAERESLCASAYRYIVVPGGLQLYGVRDRAERRLIEDGLTRQEARYMVWAFNGRRVSESRHFKAIRQSFRDLVESYGV